MRDGFSGAGGGLMGTQVATLILKNILTIFDYYHDLCSAARLTDSAVFSLFGMDRKALGAKPSTDMVRLDQTHLTNIASGFDGMQNGLMVAGADMAMLRMAQQLEADARTGFMPDAAAKAGPDVVRRHAPIDRKNGQIVYDRRFGHS